MRTGDRRNPPQPRTTGVDNQELSQIWSDLPDLNRKRTIHQLLQMLSRIAAPTEKEVRDE